MQPTTLVVKAETSMMLSASEVDSFPVSSDEKVSDYEELEVKKWRGVMDGEVWE